MRGPRRPPGRLGGEQLGRAIVIEQRLQRLRCPPPEQTGLMTEQVTERRVLLAGLAVLGPQRRHGCIELEHAAVHEPQRARRGQRLGHGVKVDEAVAAHRPCPQIDDHPPIVERRASGPTLHTVREPPRERLPHRLETRRDLAIDV